MNYGQERKNKKTYNGNYLFSDKKKRKNAVKRTSNGEKNCLFVYRDKITVSCIDGWKGDY